MKPCLRKKFLCRLPLRAGAMLGPVFMLLCGSPPLAAGEPTQSGRYTFFRDEKDAFIEIHLTDPGDETAGPDKAVWRGRTVEVPRPAPGAEAILQLPVETRLFPGTYTEKLSWGGRTFTFTWRIGPQRSDDMPILLWGF